MPDQTPDPEVTVGTPGIKTSEAWGVIAVAVPAITAALAKLSGWQTIAALGIAALVACCYAVCRTVLKLRGLAMLLPWLGLGVLLYPAPVLAAEGGPGGDPFLSFAVFAALVGLAAIVALLWANRHRWFLALAVVVLGASGCHYDKGVVAGTASIATVKTVDDGVEVYVKLANAKEDAIADQVIAFCKQAPDRAAYDACTGPKRAELRAAWDKADTAVKVYKDALDAGGAALGKRWLDALAAVVNALAALGIRIAVGG